MVLLVWTKPYLTARVELLIYQRVFSVYFSGGDGDMVFECGCGCWISKHVKPSHGSAFISFHLKVQCSFNDRVMQVGKHGETTVVPAWHSWFCGWFWCAIRCLISLFSLAIRMYLEWFVTMLFPCCSYVVLFCRDKSLSRDVIGVAV